MSKLFLRLLFLLCIFASSINSIDASILNINLNNVQVNSDILDTVQFTREIFDQGLVLGALLIIGIINLLLFYSTKERSYLAYVLYVYGFFVLFVLRFEIFNEVYGSPLSDYKQYIFRLLSSCIILISYVLFSNLYFQLKEKQPLYFRLNSLILLICIVVVLLSGVINSISISTKLVIIRIVAIIIFGLVNLPALFAVKHNYKPASIFLVANVILTLGVITNFLTFGKADAFMLKFALELSVVFQVLIFSKGIGDKISLEIKKSEEAQDKAMAMLESKVEERTAEVRFQKDLVEKKNKDIISSLHYAERIQKAIMPPVQDFVSSFTDAFILYKPKDIVAGDFYWMEKAGNKVLFSAADCTGHGVPGAMVSVMCSNALTKCVKELGITQPGLILDKCVELLEDNFSKSEAEVRDGMDLALCSFNKEKMLFEYAGANNPLYIIRKNELIETKANRQPIGKYVQRRPYVNHEFEMQNGDTIYIASDGYADQFGGEKGKKFKYSKFRELLIEIHQQPMDVQRQVLDKTIADWMGDKHNQIDDICVIGIHI